MDWRSDITKAITVQQACMRVDVDGLWEYSLPELRASEQEIADAERQLGCRLPEQYRSFLLYANGWRCFYQDVHLFGTSDLRGGKLFDRVREFLQIDIDDGPEGALDFDIDDVLPIAASMTQTDTFVIGKVGTPKEGHVIWQAGGVIEEYDSFVEYFRAMVAYDKMQAEALAKEHGIEGEPRFVVPLFEDELESEEQKENRKDS